jgi:hypothetical protein
MMPTPAHRTSVTTPTIFPSAAADRSSSPIASGCCTKNVNRIAAMKNCAARRS